MPTAAPSAKPPTATQFLAAVPHATRHNDERKTGAVLRQLSQAAWDEIARRYPQA